MVEPGSPLLAFSDHAAELVERTADSVVAMRHKRVHARLRRMTAGPTGAAAPERLSALRHPSIGAWRSKDAKPGRRKCAAGTKKTGCLTSE